MHLSRTIMRTLGLVTLVVVATPSMALAYVGPGAGVTAVGAVLAFVGAILMAIVGFAWYPIRRLLRARAKAKAAEKK